MKTDSIKVLMVLAIILLLPTISHAQVISNEVYELNNVLDKLFDEMLPLCEKLIGIGRAIAGFAALWYIAFRVWKHLAQAEPIDFYPLLRPFAIGIAIVMFPMLIGLMNGVLKPLVDVTASMSKDSKKAVAWHIQQKEKSVMETPPTGIYPNGSGDTDKYEQPDGATESNGTTAGLSSTFSFFNIKGMIKMFIMEIFQILYAAAALCINTVRTFYLIILAILGPIVFGLSVFDPFANILSTWFSRYISTYLWLPVANIFGAISAKILENMMILDQGFFSSVAYIIFMIICIVGYFTVPTVAGYIIQAGEIDAFKSKITETPGQIARTGATIAKAF